MIVSLVIGALLIATGLALLARPRAWDWANDQISLRASELWPPEDRDKVLDAYDKILRGIRRFAAPFLLLLGLAAVLVVDTGLAAVIGGATLLEIAGVVAIFRRFLPTLPFLVAWAVLLAGSAAGIAFGLTGSAALSLEAGAAFGVAVTAGLEVTRAMAVVVGRKLRLEGKPLREMGRAGRRIFVAMYLLTFLLVIAPFIGLGVALGIPWQIGVAWLAIMLAGGVAGLCLAFRAARSG